MEEVGMGWRMKNEELLEQEVEKQREREKVEDQEVEVDMEELDTLASSPHGRLQVRSRGLLRRLLLQPHTPAWLGLVAALCQAASSSLPPGSTFPSPRGLPGVHPPLPSTFTIHTTPRPTIVWARSETSQRLTSQEDVGQLLWPAAMVMARWLLRTFPCWVPPSTPPSSCSLLELGAGIGVTGLAAAQVVGRVTLSDFQPSVLANLRYNVALLEDLSPAASSSTATALPQGHRVDVTCVDWTDLGEEQGKHQVIIGSDIICSDEAGVAAAATVEALLEEGGRGYFVLPPPHVRFGVSAFTSSLLS